MESVGGVPEILYESFKAIKNPRRFAIFDYLCKSKRGVTTKELELSLHESINIVDDTLREFEHLNLAKFEGRAAAPINSSIKAGDWEGKFKTYSITEHGHNLYKLCRAYDSEKPLSNLSGSLDPKEVVEGFAKM